MNPTAALRHYIISTSIPGTRSMWQSVIHRSLLLPLSLTFALVALTPAAESQERTNGSGPDAVSALGRLEPEDGIIRVAAPAMLGLSGGVVIRDLLVDEGDDVDAGQLLAVTDLAELMEAIMHEAEASAGLARDRARAAQRRAESACALVEAKFEEARRREQWDKNNVSSKEEFEAAHADAISARANCAAAEAEAVASESAVEVAEAALRKARVDLRRTEIRAPSRGRIVEILARPGELVTSRGALELGRVDRMYAIAEVYETDARRVRKGQTATVTSSALDEPLTGVVEHVRLKVRKNDEIDTDPAARKDARIVEVEVLLDDPEPAARFTNLQVVVLIGP